MSLVELFDKKSTLFFCFTNSCSVSLAPGMAVFCSQTTPSQSKMNVSYSLRLPRDHGIQTAASSSAWSFDF